MQNIRHIFPSTRSMLPHSSSFNGVTYTVDILTAESGRILEHARLLSSLQALTETIQESTTYDSGPWQSLVAPCMAIVLRDLPGDVSGWWSPYDLYLHLFSFSPVPFSICITHTFFKLVHWPVFLEITIFGHSETRPIFFNPNHLHIGSSGSAER